MQESDLAPPSSSTAEAELLGSLLTFWAPDIYEKARAVLGTGKDFYVPAHVIVWRGIGAVYVTGAHVDVVTVGYFLSGQYDAAGRSFLELAGTESYLAVLAAQAGSYGVVERALIVATDAKWRRRLISAYEQADACKRRDEAAYVAATGQAPRLRVIEGGEAVAS